jgi:inhibitor of cysteine peptidase
VAGLYFVSAALVGAYLASASVVSHAEAAEAPRTVQSLSETDNGRTIDLRPGDKIEITLPENATTGYRWAIDRYDEALFEAVSTEPRYEAKAVGSGGEVAFVFQANKIGAGEIALKHWRHFEGESSVTRRFRVRLRVKK